MIDIVINVGSGITDRENLHEKVRESIQSSGIAARIHLARNGKDVARLAQRAAANSCETLVAAGGDGTINTVACIAAEAGKIFGVIPTGTFNFFAKNVQIPLEPDLAIRTLAEGKPIALDVAKVNDRIFLTHSSLGLYPSLIRERERTYRNLVRSKWAAYISGALSLLRFNSKLHVRINAEDKTLELPTPLMFVGANQFQMENFDIPGQRCIRSGRLAFCIVRWTGRWGLLRLAVRGFFGRVRGAEELQVLCAREAWVETRRRSISMALDGEVVSMRTPLHYRIVKKGLKVIVPEATVTGDK